MRELKATDKITQKMTRGGAVSENLATGEVEHISSREPETELSASSEESAGAAADLALRAAERHEKKSARKAEKADTQAVRDGSAARQHPSSRLQFTEEERALPELERAVRKADRAAVKLEKAEAKIPRKTVKVKKRVVDAESGKVTTRLFFEEADKKRPPSRLAHAARKAPLDTVRSAVHRKLREEGGDNPGTEAANTLTETAERTWRIAESAHRSHAEKPYRRADKAEAAADKANLKALNKQYEQEYGRASNPYSRWRQKQAIKKEYAAAKAGNGARNTVKASETAPPRGAKRPAAFLSGTRRASSSRVASPPRYCCS